MKCNKCGLESEDEILFVPRYDRPEKGFRKLCKKCNNRQAVVSRVKFRQKRRTLIRKAKDVPCKDCNIKYPYYIMDFDHLANKEFTIGDGWYNCSLSKIKEEIEKCEVVCSNCHRTRTHLRREKGLVVSPVNHPNQ